MTGSGMPGVFWENVYDTEGNFIGEIKVDTLRKEGRFSALARTKDGHWRIGDFDSRAIAQEQLLAYAASNPL